MCKFFSIALAAALAQPCAAADFREIGQEVLQIVRDKFYDPKLAAQWSDRHENYGARVKDALEFSRTTNDLLAELKVSHTRYYAPDARRTKRGLKEAIKYSGPTARLSIPIFPLRDRPARAWS